MAFEFQRAPAKIRQISDIVPADMRVRIIGKVASKSENSVVIDDSSGRAEVMVDPEFASCLNEGEVVRIFAKVLSTESSFRLQSEIIQDMNKMDTELYRKVFCLQFDAS
jgi:RNase P/RNase MRP subunit p29